MHNIMSHYWAHSLKKKKGNTHRSEQLQFCANFTSTKACLLVTFSSYQQSTPGRNGVSLCCAIVSVCLCKLSPLAEGFLALHKSSWFTFFFCDWQKGDRVSTMRQLNPPWEFNMLYHRCPTPHAFYNHSHHLFIMSWTWGGLKADVTHDDLTSMGEWTRWLIVSKTNTLIISRRAQCNRSLTTNLYLS